MKDLDALEVLDVLKMRVLLCFLNEEPKTCTVTGLSSMFGEGKQKMHRLLASLEKDGLLDRSNPRRPCLTALGTQKALYYENRTNIVLNHLLYEGLDIDNAEHDAAVWALFSSEEGMKILQSSEQRYRAKYELRKQEHFDGAELCRHLRDGEYCFPFLFYREQVTNGSNLSMANGAFAQPCLLRVENGAGTIFLQPLDLSGRSQMTGQNLHGRVRSLKYRWEGTYLPAETDGKTLSFPVAALSFLNIGSGMGQILHGSVCLKMQASVGTNHMPESTAIFTMMI